ncbi:MAG TPA: hypothetical protein VE964_08335 [Myxococcales bacterium]|nr:hypothetical protein [Myxococcales bacterium]
MREFASPATRASTLPRPVRVLYTAFCALTVAGLLSCIALYDGVVQFGARTTPAELYAHLVTYYQPPVDGPPPALAAPARGMSSRKLLEVTHFHLFSMPMYLLVLGHLFLLTGLSARAKAGWITAAGAATLIHLAAPWCVHFGGGALAWIYPISGAALLVTFAVLMGVPLYEMWARPAAQRAY